MLFCVESSRHSNIKVSPQIFFGGPSVMNCIMVMCRFRNDTIWNDMKNVVVLLPHLPPMSTTFFFSLFFSCPALILFVGEITARKISRQCLPQEPSLLLRKKEKKTNFFFGSGWRALVGTPRGECPSFDRLSFAGIIITTASFTQAAVSLPNRRKRRVA